MNRAQTYSALTSVNPRVPKGFTVLESDTGRAKTGDGWTRYNDLPYLGEGAAEGGEVGGVSQGEFDALAAQVAAITSNVNAKQDAGSAATDAELTAATNTLNSSVSTLSAALAAKQDSSSAATDAELAAAVADVNTSISNLTTIVSSKQDTSAASSALSAAVASLNAAIALKADTTAVTANTTAIAGKASRSANYVNGGSYLQGQMVFANSLLWVATANFTAAGAFTVAEPWKLLNSGIELGYIERDTQDTTTNTATTDAALNANLIAGLALTGIVGTGSPVDVEVAFPVIVHSVLAKSVGAAIMVNGTKVHSSQAVSNSTTVGTFFIVKKRLVLPAGVSHDFAIGKYGSTGTSTYYADAVSKMSLSVVQK